MRKKIENHLRIGCNDLDLTKLSHIEFFVRQSGCFSTVYSPTVTASNEMLVVIPFADAMRLRNGPVSLQFAFVDENGIPDASEIEVVEVADLLKEAGYAPV